MQINWSSCGPAGVFRKGEDDGGGWQGGEAREPAGLQLELTAHAARGYLTLYNISIDKALDSINYSKKA
jgi:hypothetical protein